MIVSIVDTGFVDRPGYRATARATRVTAPAGLLQAPNLAGNPTPNDIPIVTISSKNTNFGTECNL
jgi:hypothetical protein